MIKNGFLQQSARDDVDMYCCSEKQIKILELMINFYHRAFAVLKAGCPLTKVVALPVCDEIVRIKYSVPNTELNKIIEIANHFNGQFAELESVYGTAEASV